VVVPFEFEDVHFEVAGISGVVDQMAEFELHFAQGLTDFVLFRGRHEPGEMLLQ
jgi:hypothetical protein